MRGFSMDERDIEAFTVLPWVATSSDAGVAMPSDGPDVHVRHYGTFTRKIRHYMVDRGTISVEAAIRSMTSSCNLGDDTPGDASKLHFPSYGAEAARYLVKERRVGALGVDVASIDYGQTKDFIVHQIVAEGQVAGLENLTNLHLLPPTGAVAITLPMKIEGGSGGPLRAVALIPR